MNGSTFICKTIINTVGISIKKYLNRFGHFYI